MTLPAPAAALLAGATGLVGREIARRRTGPAEPQVRQDMPPLRPRATAPVAPAGVTVLDSVALRAAGGPA